MPKLRSNGYLEMWTDICDMYIGISEFDFRKILSVGPIFFFLAGGKTGMQSCMLVCMYVCVSVCLSVTLLAITATKCLSVLFLRWWIIHSEKTVPAVYCSGQKSFEFNRGQIL